MSAIFPTSPANVQFHLIPNDAKMITYRVTDYLVLSAWMPNGYHTMNQKSRMSNNQFFRAFCDGCIRNCYDFLEEFRDGDGVLPDEISQSHCFVYDEGYHGQHCPEDYVKEERDIAFKISDMVFESRLNYIGELPRFSVAEDRARLQAGMISPSGELLATDKYMAANVFGDESYPSNICWGNNPRPTNLRELVTEYFNTPFNNDLLPIRRFKEFSEELDYKRDSLEAYSSYNVNSEEKLLCESGYDAIMTLDAENDVTAFFTMLMAGYKNLEKAPHIILVPMVKTEFMKNGNTYVGYKTVEDDVQKTWYVHPTSIGRGILVGQI